MDRCEPKPFPQEKAVLPHDNISAKCEKKGVRAKSLVLFLLFFIEKIKGQSAKSAFFANKKHQNDIFIYKNTCKMRKNSKI